MLKKYKNVEIYSAYNGQEAIELLLEIGKDCNKI